LDTYLDALKKFPKKETILKTEKGDAVFVKMDIFKEEFWYTYKNDSFKWYKLDLSQLNEIIDANKGGEVVSSLEDFELELAPAKEVSFEDAVGEDSLTRFDQPKRKGNRKKNKNRKPQNKNRQQGNKPQQQNQNKPKQGANKKGGQKPSQNSGGNPNQQKNNNRNRKPRPPRKDQKDA